MVPPADNHRMSYVLRIVSLYVWTAWIIAGGALTGLTAQSAQSPDRSEVAQAVAELPDVARFRFDVSDLRPYRMISTNNQTISLNGYAVRDAQIVTRVQIEPQEPADGVGRYSAVFSLTESTRQQGQPVGLESQYESEYRRTPLGAMEIDEQYVMPVARDLPVFPERMLSPGDTWTAEAREVHDLSAGYNLSEPLRFSFPVSYEYLGPTEWNGQAVYEISASYNIFHREQRDALLYPATISGESRQRLYWDPRRGRLAGTYEEYWIEFRLSDGRTITYQGNAETTVEDARPLDRNTVVETMQRLLDEAGIENTRVATDQDGVLLVLENIGFPPDSARILPDERRRLEIIADILGRFPENDLLITGHTALAGTQAGREQLSIDRARAVGEFFLDRGIREPEQVLFRGLGATEPIADNSTAEGRRRNRRVEIMVLDN